MPSAPQLTENVLELRDLAFFHPPSFRGQPFRLHVPALDIREGEVLALCGPSGSGKSTLLAIMAGLLRPESGQVTLATANGPTELFSGTQHEWRRLRRYFGFVHQDPRESLNDRRNVADIVADPLQIHRLAGIPTDFEGRDTTPWWPLAPSRIRHERLALAVATLQRVGISGDQAERSPAALSGGQRQRVAIARALVAQPRLVFLDEPTSALDVSVQASIVDLLRTLRRENEQTSYVLVTHDLPLARQLADRVAILDQGQIVELGDVDDVFQQPASATTRELLGIAQNELDALGDDSD